MISEVSAVYFRQNLGEMLNQVQYRNDSIVINKDGKPVAALVDAELFARIRRGAPGSMHWLAGLPRPIQTFRR